MLAELGLSKLRTLCHAEYNVNWIMEGLVINRPSGTLPLYLCLSDFSQELKKTMVQMGSYSDMRKYSPPWHFSYFVALQPGIKIYFLLLYHLIYTTCLPLWRCKIFSIVKQTRNKTKKLKTWACITIHPPQQFVEPPFVAITAASLLGYVSIGLAHLATGIFAHSTRQNCSSSFKLLGSAGVQQSLIHTTDFQLDSGLGFD